MSGDASVKAYAAMQDLAAIAPGPWTVFSLQHGWSVTAPWTGAWVRYHPLLHAVEVSLYASVTGATVTDDTVIGVVHDTDNDPRITDADGNVTGNSLRPPQVSRLACLSNAYQATTPSSPRLHFNVNGEVRCYGIATAATWVSCHDGACYSMFPM